MICKHIHAVFERILPSVQHNIVNILRKREVERRTKEIDKTPERLQKDKEREEKKEKIEEARKTKNKGIKDKLLEALHKEDEARLLHDNDLENQVPEAGAVQRDEPATEPHEEAPVPKKREPEPELPEEREIADIADLTDQEEKKIEELHKENKPHLHKGLPYDADEGEE